MREHEWGCRGIDGDRLTERTVELDRRDARMPVLVDGPHDEADPMLSDQSDDIADGQPVADADEPELFQSGVERSHLAPRVERDDLVQRDVDGEIVARFVVL